MNILLKKISIPKIPKWIKRTFFYLSALLLVLILFFELKMLVISILYGDSFAHSLWGGMLHGFLAWIIDSRYLIVIISLFTIINYKQDKKI